MEEEIKELKADSSPRKTILDAVESLKNGFYAPIIFCLNQNLITKDFTDGAYSPLHYAIFQNNMEMVELFLNYFQIDVNFKSSSNQTPLMLAVSRRNHFLTKHLLDLNIKIDEHDSIRMNSLQYCLNYENSVAFFYLLYKGEDFQSKDINGCSLVHRAAYKDSKFILQVLKTFGFPLFEKDNFQFSPIERAISNYAYSSFKFLFKEAVNQDVNISKISSEGMKAYISDKKKSQWIIGLKSKWTKSPSTIYNQSYIYSLFYLFYFILLINAPFPMLTDVWETILMVCSYAYTIFFIMKIGIERDERRQKKGGFLKLPSNIDDDEENEANEHYDFTRLNLAYNFFKNNNSCSDNVLPKGNFIYKIVNLFEKEKFRELDRFDFSTCCSKCLTIRKPRVVHCKYCDDCVSNYSHHSLFFARCITTKIHPFYFSILILQNIILGFFLLSHINFLSSDFTSWRILFVFEAFYLYLVNFGLFQALSFLLVFLTFVYNFCFMFCEFTAIVFGLTHFELFNPHKCKYLYQEIDIKSDHEKFRYTRFLNSFDRGILRNLLRYIFKRV